MKYKELEKLIEIVETLRSENGCQWDREQTHQSLRPNMLEEAYEAVDAIDENNISMTDHPFPIGAADDTKQSHKRV
jgi:uncharacterized protein YabN with tetrapyrrole methylase and pyrophosphatase domain